ncbi:hypothetical protein ACC690_39610, partial [Rhizobium johnstonii]|uniref:hypothetical protein n=1 Tax=Rhizobium johnstonii TaxID=3019933 RepID=UPI003F99AABE
GRHAPDAYLMAVAAGASLDFLTPFGHHNNTLAMGIGGYRFGDFQCDRGQDDCDRRVVEKRRQCHGEEEDEGDA